MSPQTPDTFQARVLDLPMLLQELAEVAILSGEDDRWAAYLPMIGEELQDAQQVEATYLARDARLRAAIEAIVNNIVVDSKTPTLVYERAQIALTLFGQIERRWKDHAREIANNSTHEKALFLHRLSTLATHVLARGLEVESLATISADTCQAAPAEFIEIVTACISNRVREFQCVLALDGQRGDLAALVGESQFSQVGRGRGIRQDPVSHDWHTSNDDRFFVGVSMQAVSPSKGRRAMPARAFDPAQRAKFVSQQRGV